MKKTHASLKFRIVAILCVVLFCSVFVSAFSAYRAFWPTFQAIEQDLAEQNTQRVRNAVLHDIDTLSVIVADWALWDDSYAFVREPGDAYIRSNLSRETFWQNDLSGAAYLDADGIAVWAQSYDFKNDRFADFPIQVHEYVAHVLATQGELPSEGLTGLVRVADGYALMSARGIRDSREQEPPVGALIMLRRFDEGYLDRLRNDLRTYVYTQPFTAPDKPSQKVEDVLLAGDVRTLWFDLPVLNSMTPLRFYVETSRSVTMAAEDALIGDITTVVIGSLAVFIVMMLVLERQVVRPLSILSRGLIARQENPMARIGLRRLRNDEIGLIAQEVDRLQSRIIDMALKDDLTGLPNRRLFDDRLEQAAERADRKGTRIAVLFIDLDGFKPVNDKYGHQEGDNLLRQVAARFRQVVRGSDTVARFGGDEFAMVVEFRKDARLGVEVLCRKLLQQLEKAFPIRDSQVRITASIGCSIYPDQAQDTVELLRMADEAMYHVKNGGKANWMLYSGGADADGDDDNHTLIPNHAIR